MMAFTTTDPIEPPDWSGSTEPCAECGVPRWRHSSAAVGGHPFAEQLSLFPDMKPAAQLGWLGEPEEPAK